MRSMPVIALFLLSGLTTLNRALSSSQGELLALLNEDEEKTNIYRRKRPNAHKTDGSMIGDQFEFTSDGLLQIAQTEGSKLEPRIVGGTPTNPGEYPFYVHVANEELCGGSLIYPDIVLTAAHCQDVWTGNAIIGSTDLFGRDDAEQIEIEELRPHPDYVGIDVAGIELNDVMIVKLAQPSMTGQLITLNTKANIPVENEAVVVIGFGQTSDGGDISLELLDIGITTYNFGECIDNLGDIGLVPEEQICAGELAGGKDSCSGDSGGPLLDASKSIQYGIVSFGIGCAEEDTPAVYSRVSSYLDFIQRAICEMSANPPPTCFPSATFPPSPLTPPATPLPPPIPTRMPAIPPIPSLTRPPTPTQSSPKSRSTKKGWNKSGKMKGKGKGNEKSKGKGKWGKGRDRGGGIWHLRDGAVMNPRYEQQLHPTKGVFYSYDVVGLFVKEAEEPDTDR